MVGLGRGEGGVSVGAGVCVRQVAPSPQDWEGLPGPSLPHSLPARPPCLPLLTPFSDHRPALWRWFQPLSCFRAPLPALPTHPVAWRLWCFCCSLWDCCRPQISTSCRQPFRPALLNLHDTDCPALWFQGRDQPELFPQGLAEGMSLSWKGRHKGGSQMGASRTLAYLGVCWQAACDPSPGSGWMVQ